MKEKAALTDLYYRIWAFAMPVTSFLLVPSIQGTTIGYMMCFLSVPLVLLFGGRARKSWMHFVGAALVVWLLMLCTTQVADVMAPYDPDFSRIVLVEETDPFTFILRKSMFTQSVYVAAVVLYAAYVYHYYKPTWDQWLLAAITLFALYGMFEVAYFVITGQPGDFISNRAFGDQFGKGIVRSDGTVNGSSFQQMDIGGMRFQRLKALTGEPSMYAMSMFPFWVYFNATSRVRWPVWIIGISLLMSTSSTVLIGYAVFALIRMRKLGINPVKALIGLFVLCVIAYIAQDYIADLFKQMVTNKLEQKDESGSDRALLFVESMRLWFHGTPMNQLFGIGFGYVRSTDLFSTLMVNTGIIGTIFISGLMLYPAFKLDWDARGMALRQCCVATWTMMMVSVPEFAYLAPWTLVAMAYVRVRALKLARQQRGDEAAASAMEDAQLGASIGTSIGRHVAPELGPRIGSRFGPRGRHL
ncbi:MULTISPECIES: hypothetical protein [unclassified Caballeronia]|uniref:hypothetical protein n=1 Tax=unclassified Caballeronia TaxID=2646786 RepID=UPI00286286BE|nr:MULTISPECIES: hypothetical protein [unclassified Caballeronia]MDR5818480.1 hypothetical protein [Caballeronia sp. LZ033]MDR5825447.1 hypothetical protein [Caballeronia sp. LZ043]